MMRAPIGSAAAMRMEPNWDDPALDDEDEGPEADARSEALAAAAARRRSLFPSADELYLQAVAATESFPSNALVGYLKGLLQQVCEQRDEAIRELQLACDETCNSYHDAGHMARVVRNFGICEQTEDA